MRRGVRRALVAAGIWVVASSAARADVFVDLENNEGTTGQYPYVIHYLQDGQSTYTFGGGEDDFGLAIGNGGTLYFTPSSLGLTSIEAINASTAQPAPPYAGGSVYTEPGGITVGPDGELYAVTNSFAPTALPQDVSNVTGLVKLDATTGQYISTVIDLGAAAEDSSGDGNYAVKDVAFGADQVPYISTPLGIIRSSTSSIAGQTFIAPGTGGLSGPLGLAFGPNGNLFVVNSGTGSILEFNAATGAFVGTFIPAGAGGMVNPDELAFAPDGNLYVTSNSTSPGGQPVGSILKFNATTGDFVGTFATDTGGDFTYLAVNNVPEPAAAGGLMAIIAGTCRRRRR